MAMIVMAAKVTKSLPPSFIGERHVDIVCSRFGPQPRQKFPRPRKATLGMAVTWPTSSYCAGLHCFPRLPPICCGPPLCVSDNSLNGTSLLEEIPAYDPARAWLSITPPKHPFFDKHDVINEITRKIKEELLMYALEGAYILAQGQWRHLRNSIVNLQDIWQAAIMVQKYGVIYPMTRREARELQNLVKGHVDEFEHFSKFLQNNNASVRIMNFAVHRFVTAKQRTMSFSEELVPIRAISAVGPDYVCVRYKDFFELSEFDSLMTYAPLFDFHDFAHLSTATLNCELYGSKYFSHLSALHRDMKRLISSPGMREAKSLLVSDGIIFSEFLTGLFTKSLLQDFTSQDLVVASLAQSLCDYLAGKCGLLHPSTGKHVWVKQPMDVVTLAVLTQNKAYELPASDIEQKIFTRGGVGPFDNLAPMTAIQRVEFLAQSKAWLFFEARNSLKHRAHKEAYRLLACDLLEVGVQSDLCQAILDNISYKDYYTCRRLNLWKMVGQLDS